MKQGKKKKKNEAWGNSVLKTTENKQKKHD